MILPDESLMPAPAVAYKDESFSPPPAVAYWEESFSPPPATALSFGPHTEASFSPPPAVFGPHWDASFSPPPATAAESIWTDNKANATPTMLGSRNFMKGGLLNLN